MLTKSNIEILNILVQYFCVPLAAPEVLDHELLHHAFPQHQAYGQAVSVLLHLAWSTF